LEKKIINWPLIKKEEKALLLITCLIFCLTFIIFWEIRKPQTVMLIINSGVSANNQFPPKEGEIEEAIADKKMNWQSFGDNFSSFAYLNTDQTDMYLDDVVTALIFPPQYSLTVENCLEENCNFKKDENTHFVETSEDNSLADLELMPTPLPLELQDRVIKEASLDTLDGLKVASFIVNSNQQEQVYVYLLSNKMYKSLITNDTSEKIITKYGKSGGHFSVRGSDNNFIMKCSSCEF
jgi:hypothetical protein